MSSALALALLFLCVLLLPLGLRARGPLNFAGGVAARAAILLSPPAARDALSLLNCASVALSPAGCSSLNGCSSSSSTGSRSSITVRVLASNPFFVCWAPGASHAAAGGVAVAAVAVVVLAFPLVSFSALFFFAKWREMQGDIAGGSGGIGQPGGASAIVVNPLRRQQQEATPPMSGIKAARSAAPAPTPPLYAPFLSDYRAGAWYTRHADLALTLLLAALQVGHAPCHVGGLVRQARSAPPLQAFVPTPASKAALVGKATAIVTSTLTLALHAVWARPFAPAQAWKGPVRAALLVLAAACAAVVAWAGALDLGLAKGAQATSALTAGAYVLVALFAVVLAALISGVAAAMLRGVREENERIRATARALAALQIARSARAAVTVRDASSPGGLPPAGVAPQSIVIDCRQGLEAAPVESTTTTAASSTVPGHMADVAFAVNPIRRGGRGVSGRRRLREERRAALLAGHPSLAAAASALMQPGATVSGADVHAACEGVVKSLGRLSADEACRASEVLLPGLSAYLDAAMCSAKEGGDADSTRTLAAVCQAMAALSDHADALTLARLGRSGAPQRLVELLRRAVHSPELKSDSVVSHALWLLGNLAADEGAATAFSVAGGAGVLVAHFDISSARDSVLHLCVAVASVSAHAAAAGSLLGAGALRPLARRLFLSQGAMIVPGDSGVVGSVADAEAASLALANVLRACETPCGSSPVDAERACLELCESDAVAGCAAVLRRHAELLSSRRVVDASEAHLTQHAADALLSLVRLARRADSELGAARVSAARLAEQAVASGTVAVVGLLRERLRPDTPCAPAASAASHPEAPATGCIDEPRAGHGPAGSLGLVGPSCEPRETPSRVERGVGAAGPSDSESSLGPVLATLSDELRSWLASATPSRRA